jgi:hypothetical protein
LFTILLFTLKYLVFFLCLLSLSLTASAQRLHFVYLQSDSLTPFFVKMGGKHFSSTTAGYLILPKLNDSSYSINLGFVGSAEVQDYVLDIKDKDLGFIIRNFGEKGWGLQNLQSGEVQLSHVRSSLKEYENEQRKKELEKAQQDSLQLLKLAATDSLAAVASAQAADTTAASAKQDEASKQQPDSAKAGGSNDAAKVAAAGVAVGATGVAAGVDGSNKESTDKKAAAAAVAAPKFLDMELGGDSTAANAIKPATDSLKQKTAAEVATDSLPKSVTDSITTQPPVSMLEEKAADSVKQFVRVPCVALASRDEVDALLTAAPSPGADAGKWMGDAKKLFSQKCMNTAQIKKLGAALPDDATKYRLLEMAWPHTVDYFNFADLRSLLSDEAMVSKFNKLVQ